MRPSGSPGSDGICRPVAVCAGAVVFLTLACGASDPGEGAGPPSWDGTIETRDGVAHVRNPPEGLWEGIEPLPLRLSLDQVFGADRTPREAILGQPYGLSAAVDGDSNVYVLDGQQDRIVAFSPDGGVRWSTGREGEGPGELQDAEALVHDGAGSLVHLNQHRSRLDFWDLDGNHFRSLRLDAPPLGDLELRFPGLVGFVAADTVVLSGALWGRFGATASVVDLARGEVVRSCEVDDLPGVEIPARLSGGADVGLAGDRIVFGSGVGYELRVFDARCQRVRTIGRPVDYPVRSGWFEEDGSRGMSSFGNVGAPVRLATGHWLVHVQWAAGIDDPDRTALERVRAFREGRDPEPLPWFASLDLFDPEGRFLLSLVEEGSQHSVGRLVGVGPEGSLYTIDDDPYPQVRRYRIELDPPR